LGADSFISVVKIGPSSIRLVRAAAGAGAGFVGAGTGVETVAVWLLIGRSFLAGLEQRLRRTVFKNRAAASLARLRFVYGSWLYIRLVEPDGNASFLGLA
jgi:hypothetical protein